MCNGAVQVARADQDVLESSESWRLCGASKLALMNYLEAEVDDSNGPVPMEVGAVRGDKGKKGYGKGKYGKRLWKVRRKE